MSYLAIVIPQGTTGSVQINAPKGIPTGGIATVAKVVGNSLTILLIIAVILTLIYLILGGLAWVYSRGDKQKVAQARSRLTYAIIGLVVALASFFIISVIGFIFNVDLLKLG